MKSDPSATIEQQIDTSQNNLPETEKPQIKQIHLSNVLSMLFICILLALGYLVFRFYSLSHKANVTIHPEITPTPTVTPTPSYSLKVNPITGNRVYTNTKNEFSVEIPSSWKVNQNGIITKDFSPDAETSLQCGKKGIAQLSLDVSDNFRGNPPWAELFTAENFYSLDYPSWKGFFKSGGGGKNTDALSLTTIGKQKAIKFTRVWTDVTECWPKTETHYFLLNPAQLNGNISITHIEYETITGDSKSNEINTGIKQILSTFKFTNQEQATTPFWKIYTSEAYGISFNYPSTFRVNESNTNDVGFGKGIFVDINQADGLPERWMRITKVDQSEIQQLLSLSINQSLIDKTIKEFPVTMTRLPNQSIDGVSTMVFDADKGWEMPTGPLRTFLILRNNVYYNIFVTYTNTTTGQNINFVQNIDKIIATLKFTR